MYEKFYNLTGMPFQLTPDPRYFFASKGHSRAMGYLTFGLSQGETIMSRRRSIRQRGRATTLLQQGGGGHVTPHVLDASHDQTAVAHHEIAAYRVIHHQHRRLAILLIQDA